uniref:Site-specific integrase n=1 Tax=Desulfobacca acetoxidans TaxID=60893 RepID=A0A7V4LBV5_9BACT
MGLLIECPECKRRNSQKAKACKCGFGLSKFSGRVYWIQYRDHEKRQRFERIGPNKAAAEQRLRDVLSARAEGRYIKKPKEVMTSFNDLAKRYHEWSRVNNKSYTVNKHYYIDQLSLFFGARRLVDISPWLVERWKGERSKATGFTEVDRELACLKHMFNKAIEWGLMKENPAKTVKLFRKTRNRDRFLNQEEIIRFLAHLPGHQQAMMQFALLTGLRKANILNLKWSQVDLGHASLHIPADEAKGGRDLRLPLAPEAVELLSGLPRHPESDYVFYKENGRPYRDIYSGFRLAVKKAGLEDVTIHTLRHTVGSHLVMNGVDLATVKDLLGHRDIRTTLRYAHLAQDHKRQAIGKLGRMLTNMLTNPAEKEKGLRLVTVTP